MGELLGGAPFSGFFTARSAPEQQVALILYPKNFTLVPEAAVDIQIADTLVRDFAGEIRIHFDTKELVLDEDGPLSISMPIKETEIEQIEVVSLTLENVAFDVGPTITTENGTLEMKHFEGAVTIQEDSIGFHGNVTSIKITIGELELTTVS